MGLLINQGKQDTSGDVFAPIVEKDAQLVVHSLALVKNKPGVLEVCFRILSGPNKNRMVFDRVSYDAKDKMSYKYRKLRAAAGVPYTTDEPAEIDIEAILLNRPLVADLGIREYEKDGAKQKAQSINYHKSEETFSVDTDAEDENVLSVEPEPEPKPVAEAPKPKAKAHKEEPKPEPKQAEPEVPQAQAETAQAVEAVEEIADDWE